ncbi:MAG: adenine phosphoribosyltransferase [Povalibacter sp.]
MKDLKQYIRDVPDFPSAGVIFRDIAPLLRDHFAEAIDALSSMLREQSWSSIDAVAGVESRGFILAAALAERYRKGFVPIRKKGKLPPPVLHRTYELEYGSGTLEIQPGSGRLLIVDDVLATGGTLRASAELASDAGYLVSGFVVLIDLRLATEFRWRDLPALSVLTY